MDFNIFIKDIIEKGLIDTIGRQADVYVFTLDEKKYILKLYKDKYWFEGEILMKVNHTNIVKCCGYGKYGSRVYLVLEYIDGKKLDREMWNKPKEEYYSLNNRELFKNQLESIRNYLSENQIHHKEIRPGNILVDKNGN